MTMHDDILTGITQALYDEFVTDDQPIRPIYTETVPQDFDAPSFFVDAVSSIQEKRLNDEYDRVYSFDVVYFPSDSLAANKEMQDIGDMLFFVLEYITLENGDRLRGSGMSRSIVDGVLHFSVAYSPRVRRPIPEETTVQRGSLNGIPLPNTNRGDTDDGRRKRRIRAGRTGTGRTGTGRS